MDIKSVDYKWNGTFVKRNETRYIILHHRAGDGDVQSIHRQHVNANRWTGIGYHFYVRKDGSVYRGRPIDKWGAHCVGYNDKSIGVCFEGDFSKESMTSVQKRAGQELVAYLKELYPDAEVSKHSDFDSTACPGKNFPFEEIGKGDYAQKDPSQSAVPTAPPEGSLIPSSNGRVLLESANDIIWELSQRIKIHEVDRAVAALEKAKNEDSSLYWILYKIVNKEE